MKVLHVLQMGVMGDSRNRKNDGRHGKIEP